MILGVTATGITVTIVECSMLLKMKKNNLIFEVRLMDNTCAENLVFACSPL
jgi:hypothetical protein